MKGTTMRIVLRHLLILSIAGIPVAVMASAQNAPAERTQATVRVALSRSLPSMNGDGLRVTVVEVAYAPGASSPPHSHPCPVVGYVVSGALRTQVEGEPEVIYKAGETFFEQANGVHQISANASNTEPAKFVAYFVCDHETELSTPPVHQSKGGS
jgi:quercetin dioxygenase-like cupin family protein